MSIAAWDAVVAGLTSARLDFVYEPTTNVATAAGSLVTLDDYRGSGGPQLVPNGGLGGTAPTIDGSGYIVTNGVDSFLANAVASTKTKLGGVPRTLILLAKWSGAPTAWAGIVGDLATAAEQYAIGTDGSRVQILGGTAPAPLPNAAPMDSSKLIAIILANNGPYLVTSFTNGAQAAGEVTIRGEVVGRGPGSTIPRANNSGSAPTLTTVSSDPVYTVGNAFLSIGRVGAAYGALTFVGALGMNVHATRADRRVLNTFFRAIGVSQHDRTDARGLVVAIGTSLTAGATPHTEIVAASAFATPADSTQAPWPSQLQGLLTAGGYAFDVVNWGMGGCNLNKLSVVVAGNVTSWIDDTTFFLDPDRPAAGYPQYAINEHGTNDYGNQALTGAQLQALMQTWAKKAAAMASVPVIGTTIPRGSYSAGQETNRTAGNALLVAKTGMPVNTVAVNYASRTDPVTGLAPFRDAGAIGGSGAPDDPTYYDDLGGVVDTTHLRRNGYLQNATQIYDTLVAVGATALVRRVVTWEHTRPVTVDHTKVVGNVTAFPWRIVGTYTWLATVDNLGYVYHPLGYDIALFLDAARTQSVALERVVYTATTGVVELYGVSDLSATVDATLYVAFGNVAIVSDQTTPTAVWDADFRATGHAGDGTTASYADSTSNANSLAVGTGTVTATAGNVTGDGAINLAASSDIEINTAPVAATPVTLEILFNPAGVTTTQYLMVLSQAASALNSYGIQLRNNGIVRAATQAQQADTPGSTITASAWHYAAAIFPSDGSRTILVNQTTPVTNSTAATGVPAPDNLTIGCIKNSGSVRGLFVVSGTKVAEWRVSRIARSVAWCQTTDNNLRNPSTFYSVGAQTDLTAAVYPTTATGGLLTRLRSNIIQ